MPEIKKPYIGAAYYPESWNAKDIDRDIEKMKQCGMNVMRIGEFAWSNMEPEEGKFDFSLFHTVIDKLAAAGIAVIMGTPTCTPPAWAAESYPEIFMQNDAGLHAAHGARRNVCVNNKKFLELTENIVTAMAKEFADDENIIGWQIDNELAYNAFSPIGCCCPRCAKIFRHEMKEKYGDIKALNDAWDTHVWSIEYSHFSQLDSPKAGIWRHPSYIAEYAESQARAFYRYCDFQAEILHKYVHVPVGTDMMPFLELAYEELTRNLDIVQFNHYNSSDNLWEVAFWCDYLRGVIDRPFWITETSTCWGGGVTMACQTEPNFCTANSWLPITLGAEANLYWLWRVHYGGHELMHGSVVDSWCRPTQTYDEVCGISEGFKAASDMVNKTEVVNSEIALVMSHFSDNLLRYQPIVNGMNYPYYLRSKFYRPLMRAGMRPDVISPSHNLSDYKVILAPMLVSFDEYGFDERIFEWVRAGGTLICGPLSDIRTLSYAKYIDAPRGHLEEKTDVSWLFQVPGGKEYKLRTADGGQRDTDSVIYEAYSVGDKSKTLATYIGGFCDGKAAVCETPYGEGKIVTLGTIVSESYLCELVAGYAESYGITPVCEASPDVVVQARSGSAGDYLCAVNTSQGAGELTVPYDCTDILDGREYKAGEKADMSVHGVKIFKTR